MPRQSVKLKYSAECIFCANYLKSQGVSAENVDEVAALISDLDADFKLIRIEKMDFFTELATKLRDLWPSGDKNGKYPWRDSVSNLSKRLRFIWKERQLKQYSIDECLAAANKYLSEFEDNTKYMKVLKYFIFKQKSVVAKDGRINYVTESTFADLLENPAITILDWETDSTPLDNQFELV